MSYQHIEVEKLSGACGADISGIDLAEDIDEQRLGEVKRAFHENLVIFFRDQDMTEEQHKAFGRRFGTLNIHPRYEPLEGHPEIFPIRKEPEHKRIVGEVWHQDLTHLEKPPLGSILYALEVPDVGGDTLFANQHLAYDRLPDDLKSRLEGLVAKHSDRFIYGKGSMHDPASDETAGQTMAIRGDRDPYDGQHSLVRIHEGNGRPALFSTLGYVQGVVDMDDDEARSLLREIHEHQIDDSVIYRHRWEPDMAVVWDNRSVLHRATGGYEGHDRLLRRTTIVR